MVQAQSVCSHISAADQPSSVTGPFRQDEDTVHCMIICHFREKRSTVSSYCVTITNPVEIIVLMKHSTRTYNGHLS